MPERRETSDPSRATAAKLIDMIGGSWMTQVAYVAAELRIADLLANGPRHAEELARATGCHAASLTRLMRALTTLGLCTGKEDGSFALTPMGALLRSGTSDSLRSSAILWGRYQWSTWGNLLHSVRTGESARKHVIGTEGFEHLAHDASFAEVFNRAMTEITRFAAPQLVCAYDFSGARRVIDVGGGYGELLAAVLQVCPQASGIVVDMPHARDGAREHARKAGVAERWEFIVGDFFESVPPGGDLYLLKSIIHDWNDERSGVILRNCRKAMSRDARLLLVERICPASIEVSPAHQALARTDLNMLLGPGGRERTEIEFRELLGEAGFRLTKVVHMATEHAVIEAMVVGSRDRS